MGLEGIERNVENHGRDRLRDVDDSYRWRPARHPAESNNGEVEYDGDSFYFSWDSAGPVNDIGRASGRLVVQGSAGLLGKPPMFIAVEGTARIVLSPVFMDGDQACS
jgi:hypothetical protein